MNKFKIYLALLASAFLFGCAAPAQVNEMAAKETTTMVFNPKFHKNIKLTESGSIGETYGMIKGEDFEKAVFRTLKNLELVAVNSEPSYNLSVQFMSAEQPLLGLDFEVTSKIKYTLIENETQKVILNKTILAPYTATFSDAFVAANRLKLANEGSVRKNIMQFLQELSKIDG